METIGKYLEIERMMANWQSLYKDTAPGRKKDSIGSDNSQGLEWQLAHEFHWSMDLWNYTQLLHLTTSTEYVAFPPPHNRLRCCFFYPFPGTSPIQCLWQHLQYVENACSLTKKHMFTTKLFYNMYNCCFYLKLECLVNVNYENNWWGTSSYKWPVLYTVPFTCSFHVISCHLVLLINFDRVSNLSQCLQITSHYFMQQVIPTHLNQNESEA